MLFTPLRGFPANSLHRFQYGWSLLGTVFPQLLGTVFPPPPQLLGTSLILKITL